MSLETMNLKVYIILIAIVGYGCNDISRPVLKGMLTTTVDVIQVIKEEVELRPNEGLVYHNDQPFTGRVIHAFPTDVLQESTDYIAGKKDGYHRKWFADGTLAFEAVWKNGRLDGISKSWWRNGNQRSEANQVSGKLHGVQWQWYKSGVKFKQRNMNMGAEEGMQRSWRENGKVYNNYEARNGRIFGLKRASLCFQLDDEEIQIGK